MHNRRLTALRRFFSATALLVLLAGFATAQPKQGATPPASAAKDQEFETTQTELIQLLRLSPTLTTVVSHDPSLLANQEYVSRNNPQLAQFLQAHPEIARNPDFYLFTKTERGRRPDQALQRAVWPELSREREHSGTEVFVNVMGPFIIFLLLLGALLWLIHLFLENRRWTRIFNLQKEVHGRLIEKFGTNQELLTYMDTEAGKRFLEASPIPVDFGEGQRVPSAVAKIFTPLQIGVVLTLLGSGFLFLRHASGDLAIPMLVVGTAILMPGIGFIVSAGITWVLASRLGLLPERGATTHGLDMPFDPKGRQ
jgi:hypothetical protein